MAHTTTSRGTPSGIWLAAEAATDTDARRAALIDHFARVYIGAFGSERALHPAPDGRTRPDRSAARRGHPRRLPQRGCRATRLVPIRRAGRRQRRPRRIEVF